MTFQMMVRSGAAGLLAAGAVALGAGPAPARAAAAEVDYGVELLGTTIAEDAPRAKLAVLRIANRGTAPARSVELRFDFTEFDRSKVGMSVSGHLDGCTFEPAGSAEANAEAAVCRIPAAEAPGPGRALDVHLPMAEKGDSAGAAGTLTVTVRADGDVAVGNDTDTAEVRVAGHGADLRPSYFEDLRNTLTNGGELSLSCQHLSDCRSERVEEPVQPGGYTLLSGSIENYGDAGATGLHISIELPEQATFSGKPVVTGSYDERFHCAVSGGGRTAVCEASEMAVPVWSVRDTRHVQVAAAVQVSSAVRGPTVLTGGTIRVASQGVRGVPGHESDAPELDPTDDIEVFAIEVGAASASSPAPSASASATPSASASSDTGGTGAAAEPSLPITGPGVAATVVVGVAAVLAGVLLLVASRRRVTPAETAAAGRETTDD